jgi:hypothetical protein
MRKIFVLTSFLIVLNLTGIVSLANTNVQDKENPVSATMPEDIYKIISSSCTDCHAKGGKKSAMSHVNFSEWDNYSPEKKADKAADMVKMLQKKKMPPKLTGTHPIKSNNAQIETIAKWAESLSQKIIQISEYLQTTLSGVLSEIRLLTQTQIFSVVCLFNCHIFDALLISNDLIR